MRSCAVGLLAVVLVGSTAVVVPPAAAAGGATSRPVHDSGPAAAASGATGSIAWRGCRSWALRQSGAECGVLRVPLDHRKPDGRQIKLALSRVRHTSAQSRYQGPMLVNPGGPGASGLTMSTIGTYYFPESVAAGYDWIGFDPRGVGRSEPALSCDRDYFSFDRPNYYPEPAANLEDWLRRSRQYANDCRRNGRILRHIRTEDVARDMEAIRVALGAKKINFYGFSYGTYLGQVYSTLFPSRLRRAVFDSNVNPRRVFYRANLDQDVSFQRVFELWFDWVAKNNPAYRLGSTGADVGRRFTEVQAALAADPAGGKIGASEWIDIFQTAAYSTYSWPELTSLFSRFVRTGRAKPLIREFKSGTDYGDDNSFAVYNAVQCTDAPWPRQWSTWSRDNWDTYTRAPLMTWPNAWFNAPCLYWPAPAGPRVAVTGKRSTPLLLIGGTEDAATPYQGSLTVRRLFPRSSLVAIDGEAGHATSLDGNPCVGKVLNRYLTSGKLPQRRGGNRADVTCRPLPLPGADGVPRARGPLPRPLVLR